ncbi:hypothetical protein GR11A_00197 [Vibrio phage vB_VcorM_GR11A]|nr:hypothetical protein GR11A_00197 [Vibrio phage vB_VcorM_GR11A]
MARSILKVIKFRMPQQPQHNAMGGLAPQLCKPISRRVLFVNGVPKVEEIVGGIDNPRDLIVCLFPDHDQKGLHKVHEMTEVLRGDPWYIPVNEIKAFGLGECCEGEWVSGEHTLSVESGDIPVEHNKVLSYNHGTFLFDKAVDAVMQNVIEHLQQMEIDKNLPKTKHTCSPQLNSAMAHALYGEDE